MSEISADVRQQAKAMLMQSKLYRMLATIFAVVGFVIFIVLYFEKIDGKLLEAFRQPLLIVAMIIPFLPAIVLSKKADKARQKAFKMVEKTGAVPPPEKAEK